MTVAEAMKKMILLSNGNRHDINHFLKVHAYAAAIGACESLPEDTLKALELAAIVHDIACPLCREKYGNTNGKFQELEGATLTRAFFADTGIPAERSSASSGWSLTTTRFARSRARTTRS